MTRAQRQRCFGLLRSAGDVWACILEVNAWHLRRGDAPVAGYQQLCRLLAASGPGTFGELDSTGARSVLRRLCVDVTAELPVTAHPDGTAPDPGRVAGVDPGIIHPFAVATAGGGRALLVSGRAIRAEHRMHLADTKARRKAT
ncbi:hypothetical protein, partial [Actinoplanes sp. NBRC 101535]|uniref:hypothetical protein n=1 Tax=Actinoplanes sp. NBRC 101535 TaxID=3032196 RepID=UPI0025560BFA